MLYDFLKEHMLRYPNQIIANDTESMTYMELIAYAETLGKTLTKEKYGLLFDTDLDTAKALLACLYAGKTAVLLSKRYGEAHMQRIIETVKLSYLITENGVEQIADEQEECEDLSDVALVMCTSGTTGKPKGAMITHDNLITNITDISKYFGISNADHLLIARPLYHCAVLTGEFLISLCKGLRITFFAEGFAPAGILKRSKEQHVTVLCGTPTLLYHLSAMNLRFKKPLALKSIAVSGECITSTAAQMMRRAFPSTDIYNVYGLTEASPRVSYLSPKEFDSNPTSVGIPLSSLQARIVNNELLISGNSVMKGYYNNAEATAHAKQDGWLHTGDIAEMDKQGRIYIKCRKDNMIIRAGMNIYPQEIENALKEDKNISDVLAFGVKNDAVSERIHIKVVTSLSKEEIYQVCRQRLLSYELPDVIEIVDEIPKNASGKVIRYATNS